MSDKVESQSITIPTMEDIDNLQAQLDALDERVTALEGGSSPPAPDNGGTGPACEGWLTADFSAPHPYHGTDEQQIIDALTYGTSTGGAGDNRFHFFGEQAYTEEMAKINIPLWYFIANISSGNSYFKDDSSVDEAVFETLLANWQKVDPAGVSGWLFGLNYPMRGVTDAASFGRCAGNLARFLRERGLPLIGITGPDEPDSRNRTELYAYTNALIAEVKAVDENLVVCAPATSWADSGFMREMANACPGIDWFSWNMYPSGDDIGEQAWKNPQYSERAANDIRGMRNNAPYRPKAYHIGGFNMDWSCTAESQHNYCAAIFATLVLIDTLDGADAPVRACVWDSEGDGTCGFVPDPNNGHTQGCEQDLTPFAYLWGRLANQVTGARCTVTGGCDGLRTLAVKREDGGCSLVILNADQGHQGTREIALSNWPVNADGCGDVEVWQMTDDCHGVGQDGACVTSRCEGGILEVSLPDPSVTVISSR